MTTVGTTVVMKAKEEGLESLKPECHLTSNSSDCPLAEVTSNLRNEENLPPARATSLCSVAAAFRDKRGRWNCPLKVTALKPSLVPLFSVLTTAGQCTRSIQGHTLTLLWCTQIHRGILFFRAVTMLQARRAQAREKSRLTHSYATGVLSSSLY